MGDWAVAVLLDKDEGVAVLEAFRVTPLLELDDEVRGAAGDRVTTGEDDVGTLARQWQLVLEEHLHVAQASSHQVRAQGGDAALPRAALAG